MSHQLNFQIGYRYQSSRHGISLPTILVNGTRSVECDAKIDPGSEYCIFQRRLADALELDLESGHQMIMRGLTGSLLTYGHDVKLQTFDFIFADK